MSRGYYFNFAEAKEMPVVDSLIYCLFMIENSKTKINTFQARFVSFFCVRVCECVLVFGGSFYLFFCVCELCLFSFVEVSITQPLDCDVITAFVRRC